MSEFFSNYPKVYYNIDKQKPVTAKRVVNIMNRLKIRDAVFKNVLNYYPYQIKQGERPDIISYNYYGSVAYTWLILLANEIFDPFYDWPLWGKEFEKLIITKYGSISAAQTDIHHYEQILRAEIPATADTSKILEKTAIVDSTTYATLGSSEKKAITNYDYEVIERNRKSQIILIEDTYAKTILDESRKLYG